MKEQWFNADLAPIADALSNLENTVVKSRSFGGDSDLVSDISFSKRRWTECFVYYGRPYFPVKYIIGDNTLPFCLTG